MAGKKEKPQKKQQKKENIQKKQECKSCLLMLSEAVDAGQLAEALPIVKKEAVEVWTEANILEITLENGAVTFEDIMADMSEEDMLRLESLKVKQAYACDYEAADAKGVQAILRCLTEKFSGLLASDTEDFKPFLTPEEVC